MTDMERIIGTPQWCNQNDSHLGTVWACPSTEAVKQPKICTKRRKFSRDLMIFNYQWLWYRSILPYFKLLPLAVNSTLCSSNRSRSTTVE